MSAPTGSLTLKRTRSAGGVLGPVGSTSTVVLLALVVLGIVAPSIWGDAAREQSVINAYLPAGSEALLGTDGLGRDILARTLVGTRTSLGLAFLGVLISAALAIPIGTLLGTAGGRISRWGASAIDIGLSLPGLLMAVVIIAVLGTSGTGAAIAVGIVFTPALSRVIFLLTSSVTQREYVQAGRLLGVSRLRLLRYYILPNIGDTLAVTLLSLFGECVVAISALSFLGLGVQDPATDWGSQLTTGVKDFYLSPAAALAPAVMIAITSLALALLADAVAHAMNPLEHRRRTS